MVNNVHRDDNYEWISSSQSFQDCAAIYIYILQLRYFALRIEVENFGTCQLRQLENTIIKLHFIDTYYIVLYIRTYFAHLYIMKSLIYFWVVVGVFSLIPLQRLWRTSNLQEQASDILFANIYFWNMRANIAVHINAAYTDRILLLLLMDLLCQ